MERPISGTNDATPTACELFLPKTKKLSCEAELNENAKCSASIEVLLLSTEPPILSEGWSVWTLSWPASTVPSQFVHLKASIACATLQCRPSRQLNMVAVRMHDLDLASSRSLWQ